VRSRTTKTRRARFLVPALVGCACALATGVAWGADSMTTHLSFSPDRLGAPVNISGTTTLSSLGEAVPSPIHKVTVYLPAGMTIDVRGAGTCTAPELLADGPAACPADSRIGFGGGEGALELGDEVIRGPYALDLFLGPKQDGHLVVLVYANAASPVSGQIVAEATEIHGPKPYGLGFSGEVPLIPTLPEAPDGSIANAFLTFGDSKVAYFGTVHGRRKLLHVRGLVTPRSCPKGGFPYEVIVSLQDGTQLTSNGVVPCPHP
jgi:hypothetical protein